MNLKKEVKFFGQKVIMSCDGKCELSKGDKNTYEGGYGFDPAGYEVFPTKWCARQCDRYEINDLK